MTKTETPTPPKKDYDESAIIKAVFDKIGGKPEDFSRCTVTQVHSDSFRVNIYTGQTVGELGFLTESKVAHSIFYILPRQ